MTQVVVLSSDAHLEEDLRTAGFRATRLGPADLARYSAPSSRPTALLVDVRGQQQLPAGLAAFRKQHPAAGVVLVASTLDPRLMLEAMRAGVNECVHEPITVQALREAVRRVLVDAAAEQIGQLFAFVGAKGGVGATTLAVNTATALGRATRAEVLLIDLHIGQGDAAIYLGSEPRFSVIDALEHLDRVDDAFFRGLVERVKAGIDLLGASDRLSQGQPDARPLQMLLDFAIRKYRFTVLDLPRGDLAMLDALDAASTIVVVTNQEVSALRNASRLAQSLRTRYGATRVKAVVNRFDHRSEIAQADIERAIGDSVTHLIPSDYHVAVNAQNAGRPVVLEQGKLAQSFRALANDLGGITRQTRERPAGVLGRLAFRRA